MNDLSDMPIVPTSPSSESPPHHHRRLSLGARRRRRFSSASSEEDALQSLQEPSILEPPSSETSESMHLVAAELLNGGHDRRGRNSIVDVRQTTEHLTSPHHHYARQETIEEQQTSTDEETPLIGQVDAKVYTGAPAKHDHDGEMSTNRLSRVFHQIPAVLLVCLLNLMVSIPFGVAMFPTPDRNHAEFPLPDKEALGIRVFMFTTVIGQIVFTFASKFTSAISLEMVENIAFWHALAYVVIEEQGYGTDALSTLFFLFGLSSVIVGVTFYILGKLGLGRIVYLFPAHVLIGCIGGIGVFITRTSIEVSTGTSFSFSRSGLASFVQHFHLFAVVVAMEVALRILTCLSRNKAGQPRFPLLAPLFFCLITPMFYLGLVIFGVDMQTAQDDGYFFPTSDGCNSTSSSSSDCGNDTLWESIFNEHLLDMWRVVDFSSVSWRAVVKALPTIVALSAFSLIHVPINIPAYAISIDEDTDMNAELIAHGYSNALSGLFGGLQNYLCYSNSILYAKCGGEGRASSLAVAILSSMLFFVGPHIASYIPRCMAGTLLLHIGIDLILEGVYDSYGKFDNLEYAGIWLITIVMTVYGMTAALIAGVIAALSTYAAQSVTHINPIRDMCTASSFRSSSWDRSPQALAILDDDRIGRNKILLIQLHGHLFFGNVALLTDNVKDTLNEVKGTDEEPWIIILDFSLIVAIDSSAAHAMVKLKNILQNALHIEVTIFVTGSEEGFPCEFALSQELARTAQDQEEEPVPAQSPGSVPFSTDEEAMRASLLRRNFPRSRVCSNLDSALIFAEDILIARADHTFTHSQNKNVARNERLYSAQIAVDEFDISLDDELSLVTQYIANVYKGKHSQDVSVLVRSFKREVYFKDALVWTQGSESDCTKIVVRGTLSSHLEGNDTCELVTKGSFVGELGLVHGTRRLTTVTCMSDSAVLYSLSKEAWVDLSERQPRVARIMDGVVIHYLTHRVQHVSNRIFETRCLPI